MTRVAHGLDDPDIAALAQYFASLAPVSAAEAQTR
jgi:cytochrome c553